MSMDRMEEFSAPISRVLGAHPVYTAVALSLGLSVYRWNANRVGDDIDICTFSLPY